MILWTIQPVEVYRNLLETGTFACDPRKVPHKNDDHFTRAYAWISQQLRRRVGPPPARVTLPIWAWYRSANFQHRRPDLRTHRYYPDQVCIEFEIAEEAVLLSDYENWHLVLNNAYFGAARTEAAARREWKWYDQLSPSQQQQAKRASWRRVFDVDAFENEWFRSGMIVQACFWQLHREQVRRVWHQQPGHRVELIAGAAPLQIPQSVHP